MSQEVNFRAGDVDITRLRAPNPSVMTLTGTNSYILTGPDRSTIIIDPGPNTDAHQSRLIETPNVVAILLTHHHRDHSESAESLANRFGVPLLGGGFQEFTWSPVATQAPLPTQVMDVARALGLQGWNLNAFPTPGHTHDSVSFELDTVVFSGDTILGEGTTVIAYPDGSLADYFQSLETLAAVIDDRHVDLVLPGHGDAVRNPRQIIDFYIAHRWERLDQVRLAANRMGLRIEYVSPQEVDGVVDRLVAEVYADVPRHLWPAASLSMRAAIDFLRSTTS